MIVKRKCLYCSREFEKKSNPAYFIKHKVIFCSNSCSNKYNGKNNIVWNKGKKFPEFSGKNCPQWKGGKFTSNDGYLYIFVPNHPNRLRNDYLAEHRVIVEKIIGRYLNKGEIVHHINGIRNDNRPENLYLFENQKRHNTFHFHSYLLTSNII